MEAGTTSSTGDRPTFAQAFSASETPVAETPTATTPQTEETPASATETPAVEATPAQGPIPYDRHKTVLDGAYKERDDYKKQLDSLSWAQGLDRAAVEQAQQIGQLFQQDRAGYIRSLLDEALNDAALAPVLRSEFGRRLAQRTQADAPIEPDIPVYDAQGQLVSRTYSDQALAKIRARDREELKRELLAEIAPIKQTFADQQTRAKTEQQRQQVEQTIDAIYARAETLPQFKEHDAEIAAAMAEFAGAQPAEQVYLAWAKVVLPKLQASHKAQTLDELKTKATAATVNPTAAVVSTPRRPKSFSDPSLKW